VTLWLTTIKLRCIKLCAFFSETPCIIYTVYIYNHCYQWDQQSECQTDKKAYQYVSKLFLELFKLLKICTPLSFQCIQFLFKLHTSQLCQLTDPMLLVHFSLQLLSFHLPPAPFTTFINLKIPEHVKVPDTTVITDILMYNKKIASLISNLMAWISEMTLILTCLINFCWMPFLTPPVTHTDLSRNHTCQQGESPLLKEPWLLFQHTLTTEAVFFTAKLQCS